MPSKGKTWMRRLLFYPSLTFFWITRLLPLPMARFLGVILARTAWHVVPRMKTIGRANLDLAYGDSLSVEEKDRILRGAVRNLGIVAVEFSRMNRLTPEEIDRYVSVKGFSNVSRDRGAVMVGAHLGNWEWLMPAGVHLGLDMIIVVREFDEPRMNALVDRVRQDSGARTIAKTAAMGPLLRKVREGAVAGLLADQSPRDNGVPVTFFGRRTWATAGPVLIALRAHVPVHPISMVRDENGHYTFEFFPALEMAHTGNLFEDLEENTQRCQDALEAIIRAHPEQWLWFHRRWKTRDRLEQEWNARKNRRNTGDLPPEKER